MLIKIENNLPVGNPILEENFKMLFPEQAFPLVLTPALVNAYGYGMYDFSQVPTAGPYEKVVEGSAIQDQYGIWRQVWEVVPLTGQELLDKKTEWKTKKSNEVTFIREQKGQLGGYKVGTHWFHSDTFSRTQQLGLVMMGATIPESLQWKTMSGEYVAMNQSLATQVFQSAIAQDIALFAHGETLKQQINASDDPANFDITVGWPETFGGV